MAHFETRNCSQVIERERERERERDTNIHTRAHHTHAGLRVCAYVVWVREGGLQTFITGWLADVPWGL